MRVEQSGLFSGLWGAVLGLAMGWSNAAWAAGSSTGEQAAPAPAGTGLFKGPPSLDLSLGLLAVGETWEDSSIGTVYSGSRFSGAAGVTVGLWSPLAMNVEVGYGSRSSDPSVVVKDADGQRRTIDGDLKIEPMSFDLLARSTERPINLFAGGGLSVVPFNEQSLTDEETVTVVGTKLGVDLRCGALLHTNLSQPGVFNPGASNEVDVEVLLGRRWHQPFGLGQGFDMSAWRLGVGLVVAL